MKCFSYHHNFLRIPGIQKYFFGKKENKTILTTAGMDIKYSYSYSCDVHSLEASELTCLPHVYRNYLPTYRVTLNFLILSSNTLGSPWAKCCLTGSRMRFSASVTAALRSPG